MKYFNLISMRRLSLNAQFLPVPEGFIGAEGALSDFTDTVLGTLHLALCAADGSGRVVGVLFDVFDGKLKCTLQEADAAAQLPRVPGVPTPVVGMPVPCKEALALAGATVTKDPSLCNLAKMECGTVPPEFQAAYAAAMHTDDTLVELDVTRYNVSVGGARLSLLRDVIERQHGQNMPRHAAASQRPSTAPVRPHHVLRASL